MKTLTVVSFEQVTLFARKHNLVFANSVSPFYLNEATNALRMAEVYETEEGYIIEYADRLDGIVPAKTNNYTATVKLPSGDTFQYHYDATSTAEAYRYMLQDIRSDKSTFIDLSLTDAISAYAAIDALDRPQAEKDLVKLIIHHLIEQRRTSMDRRELNALGLDVSREIMNSLVTAAGYPYTPFIAYCGAVNLDSVSLNI